jgi:hypothetical protein
MANQVVPQVDIGALSLRGLSAFGPLLAALSADNVAPTAMLQMQALGSCFLTSGPYAAKVPDHLRRCTSVRLDRLALSVGWRKGDATSYMADTAGGQAVSLLALCLFSVLQDRYAADVLHGLSHKLLPRDTAIASVSQLFEVGRLLRSKLDPLGFGNLLAQQVTRVHDAYKRLGKNMPMTFFVVMSAEAMTELLAYVSQALREGNRLVRISGSFGMAHILGITLMMFPQDTLVTVENLVICEGPRKSIIVEIANDTDLRYQVETRLGTHPLSLLSAARLDSGSPWTDDGFFMTTFTWENWLADFLQLSFLELGLSCTPQVLTACCNLLVSVPEKIELVAKHSRMVSLCFLGQNPQLRMRNVCQSVFGIAPVGPRLDVKTAFLDLVKALNDATSSLRCKCEEEECRKMRQGLRQNSEGSSCGVARLWDSIGNVLEAGFCSFFVNAGPNATCFRPRSPDNNYRPVTTCIERGLDLGDRGLSNYELWYSLFATCSDPAGNKWYQTTIAQGSRSCVIFPSTLRTFRIPTDLSHTFDLVEGQLNFEGRYYKQLDSQFAPQRQPDRGITKFRKGHLVPSNHGEHSELLITARERIGHIEVRTMVRLAGAETFIPLYDALRGSWLLRKTQPCDHPMSTPLEAELEKEVETTSVADPTPRQAKTAIVQTLHNDVARFLSCRSAHLSPKDTGILLLNDCCLNCAVRQAINGSFSVIIV